MPTPIVRYALLAHRQDYELRSYGPQLVAETTARGDFALAAREGFRRLAHYLQGRNKGQRTLPMLSPVTQIGIVVPMERPFIRTPLNNGRGFRLRCPLPDTETLASLPEPLDPLVQLTQLPARRVAAHRIRGFWTEENLTAHVATLLDAVTRDGVTPDSEPEIVRYNAPWTPWFLRRTEVLLGVAAPVGPGTPTTLTAASRSAFV